MAFIQTFNDRFLSNLVWWWQRSLRSSTFWYQFGLPWFHNSLTKNACRMFNLNCFTTLSNFILISWKACEKMRSICFAFCWPCEPQPEPKSLKVVQMIEVNGAYKHWRHVKVCIQCLMFKFLPCKTDGQAAGQLVTHPAITQLIAQYIVNKLCYAHEPKIKK